MTAYPQANSQSINFEHLARAIANLVRLFSLQAKTGKFILNLSKDFIRKFATCRS